jgi:glycosidase
MLAMGPAQVSGDRRYLFVDVRIDPKAKPGRYTLRARGAEFAFEVLPPLPRAGRFGGLTQDDVVYLIMTDRFTNGDASNDGPVTDPKNARAYHGGDFRGIEHRLPYLKALGITTIWITPVVDNPRTGYHGYHAIDFYRPEEQFGDLPTFRGLVDAAHKLGLKVMLDWVANHTGAEHPWVDAPPTPSWLHGTRQSHLRSESPMWALIDPYASPGLMRAMLDGWFVNRLPDLNQDDPEVERYLIQNTLWWIGVSGIDSIRADTVPYVPKRFWQRWMRAIRREHPRFDVVGEVWSRNPAAGAHFEDTGMHLFDFPLEEAIRNVFVNGRGLAEIPATLVQDRSYARPERLVTFFGSHDVSRLREKSTQDALKSAFLLLLTCRGIPKIYYGDEIGMRGGNDPDNRRDFPGGSQSADEQEVFTHVQRLLQLRSRTPALRGGRTLNLHASGEAYVYARRSPGQDVLVAIGKAKRVEAGPLVWPSDPVKDALGSGATARRDGDFIEITGPGVFVAEPVSPRVRARPSVQPRSSGARSSP